MIGSNKFFCIFWRKRKCFLFCSWSCLFNVFGSGQLWTEVKITIYFDKMTKQIGRKHLTFVLFIWCYQGVFVLSWNVLIDAYLAAPPFKMQNCAYPPTFFHNTYETKVSPVCWQLIDNAWAVHSGSEIFS